MAPDAIALPLCTPTAPDAAIAPEPELPLPEPAASPLDGDVVAPPVLAWPTAVGLSQPNAEAAASTGHPRRTTFATNDVSRETCRATGSRKDMSVVWKECEIAITTVAQPR